jgi:hypothetical protein
MLRNLATALRFGVCLAALCVILLAHHGTATSYDNTKTFTTQATVTEFRYANPHPQLYFDVKDEQGNVAHWSGEIAPNPAQLIQPRCPLGPSLPSPSHRLAWAWMRMSAWCRRS